MGFFYDSFGKTITEDAGYNIVNTFAYVILALVLFFFVLLPLVKRWYGKLDLHFFLYTLSIIFIGAMLRVAEESYSTLQWFSRSANPLEMGFYFITPGVYLLLVAFALLLLGITCFLKKKYGVNQKYLLFSITIPIAIVLFIFFLCKMTFVLDFFLIILCILGISALIYLIFYVIKFKLNAFETLAITAQLTDGIATFSALTFYPYFREQHVVSNFVIQSIGNWVFPLIKLILVIVVIIILRNSNMSENKKNYILLFITLFGFATGLRDLFSIVNHLI
ncbi:MAG: hypothetical protein COT14_02875 [Candidatus Diapherotrites archaeon CG08_land_8_20_14_0_20_30_16]|nr:MAG: hypothetical protein COT14_02875 [Candidatus Diapherotrites archaeon CG08_land_8_20_14_0_20_30_16]